MNYKIGVIGSEDAVFPFSCLGFATFSPKGETAIRRQVQVMANDNFGIIYMTEDMIAQAPDVLAHFDDEIVPVVIPITSSDKELKLDIGKNRIQTMVEKAVGKNIL